MNAVLQALGGLAVAGVVFLIMWLASERWYWKARTESAERWCDFHRDWATRWRDIAHAKHGVPTPRTPTPRERRKAKLENLARHSDNPHERAVAATLARQHGGRP